MFTGIVQEVGEIKAIQLSPPEMRIQVDLKSLTEENLILGESIAINGACHTLAELSGNNGLFFSSKETLDKTNFQFFKEGDSVNLELPLTPVSRIGGHFVSGHVDCLAKLLSIHNVQESFILRFEIPSQVSKYIVEKGSVCLNGVSLTVAQIEAQNNIFSVAIIPHTWEHTNLSLLKAGDFLNFEVDMLAKYVEKAWAHK